MKTKLGLWIMAGALIWGVMGTAATGKEAPLQRAVFKVESLSCGACFSTINEGLGPLEGFSGMGANLLRKMVAVDFTAPLSADEIQKAIIAKGYPATLTSVDPIQEKESFAYMNRQKGPGAANGGCCSGADPRATQKPLPGSGSCCTRPGASPLPPATSN